MSRSFLGNELRLQTTALRASYGDENADLLDRRDRLADLYDDFAAALEADQASGAFTEAGLQARRRNHGEAIVLEAAKATREANELDRRAEVSVEQEWTRLTAVPTTPLEQDRLFWVLARFEREDVLIQEFALREAARTGSNDVLLRAILSAPTFATTTAIPGGVWKGVINAKLTAELQQLIRERLGFAGSDAWRVLELRSMARHAEATVAGSSTAGSIKILDRDGQPVA